MGFKVKNNLEYYQHYANADRDPKIKMLRLQYGWGGDGRFWALNNRIAQAEKCCLDISKKYNKIALAADLDFKPKELDDFLKFLLSECELIKECEPGVITTDIIQENYLKVSKDRVTARERSARRWEKSRNTSPEEINSSPEESISPPEELCKVKESKVKNKRIADSTESASQKNDFYKTKSGKKLINKRLETFNQFWDLFNYKQGKAAAADSWFKIKPLTNSIVKQINQAARMEAEKRPSLREQGQSPKWPQGWLSERRWEDEIYTVEQKTEEDIKKEYGIGVEV
jgi:hypothetical protein